MGGGLEAEGERFRIGRCGVGAPERLDAGLQELAGARAAVAEYRAEIAQACRAPRRRRGRGEVIARDGNREVGPQADLVAGGIGSTYVPAHVLAGEVEKRLRRLQDRRGHPGIAGALIGGDQEVGLRIEVGRGGGHARVSFRPRSYHGFLKLSMAGISFPSPLRGGQVGLFLLARYARGPHPPSPKREGEGRYPHPPRLPALVASARPLANEGRAMSHTHQNIIVETKGRVGLIRLNRPNALNALNSAMMEEIATAVDAFETDPGIGCLVVTGSEKAFAAGADIKEMAGKSYMDAFMGNFTPPGTASPMPASRWLRRSRALRWGRLRACHAVRHHHRRRHREVRPAGDQARHHSGHRRHPAPDPRVGKAKAMDLILTGRMMDAAEAERSGLVARVVPAEDLLAVAMKTAETIAAMSLPSVMAAKEAVNRAFEFRSPRASRSSGGSSTRCSPPRTRRKAWPPSWRSGQRSS